MARMGIPAESSSDPLLAAVNLARSMSLSETLSLVSMMVAMIAVGKSSVRRVSDGVWSNKMGSA